MSNQEHDEEIRGVLEAIQLHGAEDEDSGGGDDKLVLSPALRVEGADGPIILGPAELDESAREIAEKLANNAGPTEVAEQDETQAVTSEDPKDETEPEPETAKSIEDGEVSDETGTLDDDSVTSGDEEVAEDGSAAETAEDAQVGGDLEGSEELAAAEETDTLDGAADAESAETSPSEEDEVVLDEDTLRIIVQEVVRQELQGEMGRKMAQSIRDTVRKELIEALLRQSDS